MGEERSGEEWRGEERRMVNGLDKVDGMGWDGMGWDRMGSDGVGMGCISRLDRIA